MTNAEIGYRNIYGSKKKNHATLEVAKKLT